MNNYSKAEHLNQDIPKPNKFIRRSIKTIFALVAIGISVLLIPKHDQTENERSPEERAAALKALIHNCRVANETTDRASFAKVLIKIFKGADKEDQNQIAEIFNILSKEDPSQSMDFDSLSPMDKHEIVSAYMQASREIDPQFSNDLYHRAATIKFRIDRPHEKSNIGLIYLEQAKLAYEEACSFKNRDDARYNVAFSCAVKALEQSNSYLVDRKIQLPKVCGLTKIEHFLYEIEEGYKNQGTQ